MWMRSQIFGGENRVRTLRAMPGPPRSDAGTRRVGTASGRPSGAAATDENVRQKILKGGDVMPPYKGALSDTQIDALIAYLHAL